MSGVLALYWTFFRVGIFGFGGGYAMLPIVFQSVEQLGIMTAEEFSNLVALSQAMPGPIIVNAATYVGYYGGGVPGAAAAVLGVAMPSFCFVLLAAHFLDKFKENKVLQAVLSGIKPAVVGLIGAAAAMLAQIALIGKQPPLPSVDALAAGAPEALAAYAVAFADALYLLPCLLFVVTIVLVGKFKISPIKVILLVGAVGALFG